MSAMEQTINVQEKRARDFLAQGRFRKARDEFKALCKLDRAKHLPGLIQANIGLAKEMIGKGQISEASQVIAYLKTIATPDQLRGLEAEAAIKSGRPEEALPGLLEALRNPSSPLAQEDKIRLADQVILTFKDLPGDGTERPGLAREVQTIHQALQAVSQEQWERVLEILRPLPRSSIFGHWKVFIKGLVLFYRGEGEKAAEAFCRLPNGSAPAKASRPFLLIARPGSILRAGGEVSEPLMAVFCQLLGLPALGPFLFQADRLWKRKQCVASYQVLRKAVGAFPSDTLDVLGVLSDFYFTASLGLDASSREEWNDYVFHLLADGRFKNRVEERRAFLLSGTNPMLLDGPDMVEEDLRRFLEVHQELHGPNPRLVSQALLWLAIFLISESPEARNLDRLYDPTRRRVAHVERVLRLLKESAQVDSNNLAAQLKLCEIYERTNRKSERNRLLDALTARFPEDKKVLLQAGRGCIERKAFQKGIQYLDRAAQLDRIDPSIKDAIVEARQQQARQLYREKRFEKARKLLKENEPLLVQDPAQFTRSQWTLRITHGLLEHFQGDPQASWEIMTAAEQASPSREAFLLHSHLLSRIFAPRRSPPLSYWNELKKIHKQASAQTAPLLMRLIDYWDSQADSAISDQRINLWEEEHWLEIYLKHALKHPFTREEVLQMAPLCAPGTERADRVEDFLEKLLEQDPQDPVLRLALFSLQPPSYQDDQTREELEQIILEATRRQDSQSLRQATQLLERLKNPPPLPPPGSWPDSPDDSFDDFPEEEDEDFEVDDDAPIMPGGAFPFINQDMYEHLLEGMPASTRNLIEQLIWDMSQASDKEIEARLKNPPRDIPPEILALLTILASQMRLGNIHPTKSLKKSPPTGSGSSPPPSPPSKPASRKSHDDPNQMNLF